MVRTSGEQTARFMRGFFAHFTFRFFSVLQVSTRMRTKVMVANRRKTGYFPWWRGGRVAEGAPLLRVNVFPIPLYIPIAYDTSLISCACYAHLTEENI